MSRVYVSGRKFVLILAGLLAPLALAAAPVVIVVDGVDPRVMTGSNDRKFYTGPTANYLKDPLVKSWQGATNAGTTALQWSGNVSDTDAAISELKALLLSAKLKADAANSPLVLVAHSWGSVLTVEALSRLLQEQQWEPGDLDLLVTFGTPLNNTLSLQQFRYELPVKRGLIARFGTKSWINYHNKFDQFGKPISTDDGQVQTTDFMGRYGTNAHASYFEEPSVAKSIADDMTARLAAASSLAPTKPNFDLVSVAQQEVGPPDVLPSVAIPHGGFSSDKEFREKDAANHFLAQLAKQLDKNPKQTIAPNLPDGICVAPRVYLDLRDFGYDGHSEATFRQSLQTIVGTLAKPLTGSDARTLGISQQQLDKARNNATPPSISANLASRSCLLYLEKTTTANNGVLQAKMIAAGGKPLVVAVEVAERPVGGQITIN